MTDDQSDSGANKHQAKIDSEMERGNIINGVLIKKACEHAKCGYFKCERKDLRIGGFDI